MAHKAVFLDRDRTIMEDPGYVSDPGAVKLLPGVELAIKSLSQAGYKIVVVTNQSGVARGRLTEETLEEVHAELRRQLAEREAHLDAIYYCPFHPEGTVEEFATESDLRKPKPGMLIQAAEDLDIDLSLSWMVGDSPRDIEAGQRAGCRTIRVRTKSADLPGEHQDEDAPADFTVRNLVDAARVVMREDSRTDAPRQAPPPVPDTAARAAEEMPTSPLPPEPPKPPVAAGATSNRQVLQEVLHHLRQLTRQGQDEEFSFTKLIAGICQALAVLGLLVVFIKMLSGSPAGECSLWALIALVLQMMSLTFFIMQRAR